MCARSRETGHYRVISDVIQRDAALEFMLKVFLITETCHLRRRTRLVERHSRQFFKIYKHNLPV